MYAYMGGLNLHLPPPGGGGEQKPNGSKRQPRLALLGWAGSVEGIDENFWISKKLSLRKEMPTRIQ